MSKRSLLCLGAIFTATLFGSSLPTLGNNLAHSHVPINQNQDISESGLAALELKLLGKTYTSDPISKRLQRLELLTFGSTQYGNIDERWHSLQSFLQSKKGSSKTNANDNKNISRSLNELEKYVFKKTNPSLSITQRLNKLESKLFGKASDSLPTQRRIARLQRTLGIPDDSGQIVELPNQTSPEIKGFNNSPYFRHMQPGMPNTFGFSFGLDSDDMNDPDLSQFESQMNRMFQEMQKRMLEQQMPEYEIQPHSPRRSPQYEAPRISPPQQKEKIPSYNDPNFI